MVKDHNLQLRAQPPLFCNFHWFIIKAALAHHPFMQKEVLKLLASGAIEPSTACAGFFSSVFVVPKHSGGLHLVLNLKQYNCYMHIPSFRIPTIQQVWQLIQ